MRTCAAVEYKADRWLPPRSAGAGVEYGYAFDERLQNIVLSDYRTYSTDVTDDHVREPVTV